MNAFSKYYPHLAWWVANHGYIELGPDGYRGSLLRILDPGGMCWEDEESTDIDDALAAGEAFLVTELAERMSIRWNKKTGEFEDI